MATPAGRNRPSRDAKQLFGTSLAASSAYTPPGMKPGEFKIADDWLDFHGPVDKGIKPGKKTKKKYNRKGKLVRRFLSFSFLDVSLP